MAIAALAAFDTVVGVASLVLGAVGLARPEEEETNEALTTEIAALGSSLNELRSINVEILTRLDNLTQNDLATALVEVELAQSGLEQYRRTEEPDSALINQIVRDSEVGLEQVLAQFSALPTVIDDEVAATMAQSITYAVAVRFEAIDLFDDRAIGQTAFHDALQSAASAMETINTSMLNWVEVRELTAEVALIDTEAVTSWRMAVIGEAIGETSYEETYPGLAAYFAAGGNRTISLPTIELNVFNYLSETYSIQHFISPIYWETVAAQVSFGIWSYYLPLQQGTSEVHVLDENGDVIPDSSVVLPLEIIGIYGAFEAQENLRQLAIELYREQQTEELTISALTDAADTFRELADGVDLFDAFGVSGEIVGSAGNDLLSGLAGNDLLRGLGDEDVLRGGSGNDTLLGGDGADVLLGEVGSDQLEGGLGADLLYGGANADTVLGGNGDDTVYGGAGSDVITGGNQSDLLFGGDGGDVISGGPDAASDTIYGDAGADQIGGGGGNDLLFGGDQADVISGGDGQDTGHGGSGNDTVAGGAGNDSVSGDSGLDVLIGGLGLDTLFGGNDGDRINGNGGDDALFGELGNDTLAGGLANDSVDGGAGNDELRGNAGNDTLNGSDGDDDMRGDTGDDLIVGGSGNDRLIGGVGNDRLLGQTGNDIINGGAGDDTMTGGGGTDRFVFNGSFGNDQITDFQEGLDTLLLGGFTTADVNGVAVGDDFVLQVSGGGNITVVNGVADGFDVTTDVFFV